MTWAGELSESVWAKFSVWPTTVVSSPFIPLQASGHPHLSLQSPSLIGSAHEAEKPVLKRAQWGGWLGVREGHLKLQTGGKSHLPAFPPLFET